MFSRMVTTACALALSLLLPTLSLAGEEEPIVWVADGQALLDVRRIELYPPLSDPGDRDYVDAVNSATGVIRTELERAGVSFVAAGDKPRTKHTGMRVELVNYQKGSVGGRWVGFGGGAAIGIIRTRLFDGKSGEQVGDIVVADQIASGGLFSIGAEKHVLVTAARRTAGEAARNRTRTSGGSGGGRGRMVKPGSLLALLLIPILLLSGPTATGAESKLVPPDIPSYASTGKMILVASVIIRPQPKPGFLMDMPPRLEGGRFRGAIVETLNRANLFSAVGIEGEADYTLTTDIIGQRQLGGLSNVELLLIRYSLIDRETGRAVWAENLLSHYQLSAEQVFMGHVRMKQVLQGAARDNLAQLVRRMAEVLNAATP